MSNCSLQFHALNEEIFSFIKKMQSEQDFLFMIAADDLRLRNYEMISNVDKIGIYENRKIFFISRKNNIIEEEGKNCLLIFCGHEDNVSMQESYMSVQGEGEEFNFWKKVINKYKKTLLKGGTVYNPVTNARGYYKNMYYSLDAKKAYENGIKIKPLAGWNDYILEQKT